jgi:hypothetical protein
MATGKGLAPVLVKATLKAMIRAVPLVVGGGATLRDAT